MFQILSPSKNKSSGKKYGIKTEPYARYVFKEVHEDFQIVKTGLIISQVNQWLGYSPDGVILKPSSICFTRNVL